MYFVILNIYIAKISNQLVIAIMGSNATQLLGWVNTKASIIELKAQATQKTLYLLEAKIDAIIVHQTHVIIHCVGVAQDATAKEIDKGMFIIATVSHAL